MANENAKPETPENPPTKGRSRSWVVVIALMAVEGVGIFLGTKFFLSPSPSIAAAEGAESTGATGSAQADLKTPELAEVELSECRPINRVTGKLISFRMRTSILVNASETERAKALVEANKARIEDRVSFVIRSADPAQLNEPSLETIKRRIKSELDRILGDEKLVHEILIPEMLPSGPGL